MFCFGVRGRSYSNFLASTVRASNSESLSTRQNTVINHVAILQISGKKLGQLGAHTKSLGKPVGLRLSMTSWQKALAPRLMAVLPKVLELPRSGRASYRGVGISQKGYMRGFPDRCDVDSLRRRCFSQLGESQHRPGTARLFSAYVVTFFGVWLLVVYYHEAEYVYTFSQGLLNSL